MSASGSDSDATGPRKRARVEKGGALPPLSLSILGVEPIDEFIREIADFVHFQIMNRPPGIDGKVEVEAKIGLVLDKSTEQRLVIPVLVETPLQPDMNPPVRFESNMSANQHRHFNQMLNKLMMEPPSDVKSGIEYKHHRLTDSFYEADDNPREKVRVTKDDQTGQVVEVLRKRRLADLNIYSPKRKVDWRVSVNIETAVPHPVGTVTHSRKKDRISYKHEEFVIDLTQVVTTRPRAPPETQHELEIEIVRSELLLAAAAKRGDGSVSEPERSAFDEIIRAFVNNARILVRNAEGLS